MKKLKFERLWLLSTQEQRARTECFDDDVVAVVADNEFGKSSLVKSLYATLGADPFRTPEAWQNIKVTSLLRFTIDGVQYFMLRQRGYFALFDANQTLLWTANSIVKGLAPKLGRLLDFHIELKPKSGKAATPPPAFCFLPFYVDQDKGWNETWASFSGLAMIPRYHRDIAEFHTGIKPSEYYKAKIERDENSGKRYDLAQEREALQKAKKRFTDKRTTIGIALDVGAFQDRINALLTEQNAIQSLYDDARTEISELQALRAASQEEVEISARVLAELDKDIKFTAKLTENEIVCPTCSTVHENDFANRFGLTNDADACRIILVEARAQVFVLDKRIEKRLENIPELESRIAKIRAILEETRGQIKLGDMLKDESQRLVDQTFVEEERDIDGEIGGLEVKIADAKKRMAEFTKASHKKKITDFYAEKLRSFCLELNITDIPSGMWNSIRPSINETGSRNPRLLLAYYYAILHTISKYSTCSFCPVVIDTPLQQDPDPMNSKRMIQFAIEKRPEGTQLIIATGDLHGVEVPGSTIEPSGFRSLLSEDQYESVHEFVMPFINASLSHSITP